jgi:hypothetical protein
MSKLSIMRVFSYIIIAHDMVSMKRSHFNFEHHKFDLLIILYLLHPSLCHSMIHKSTASKIKAVKRVKHQISV